LAGALCAALFVAACSDDSHPPTIANRACGTCATTDRDGGGVPADDAGCEPDASVGYNLVGVLWAFQPPVFVNRGPYYGQAEVSYPGVPCGRVSGIFDGRLEARDAGEPSVTVQGLLPSDGDWLRFRQLDGPEPFATTLMLAYTRADLSLPTGMAITPQSILDKAFSDLGVANNPDMGHLVVQALQPPDMLPTPGVKVEIGGTLPATFDGTSWAIADVTGAGGIAMFLNLAPAGKLAFQVTQGTGATDEHQVRIEAGAVTFAPTSVTWKGP
jgi:hypothetical protein